MKYTVERIFSNINRTCHGAGYRFYENVLQDLIHEMRNKIGCSFKLEDQYHDLRFAMNIPLYREFCITCQALCYNSNMYKGIKIMLDPTLYMGNTQSPDGIVRLVYEESETKLNPYRRYCNDDLILAHELYYSSVRKGNPHIDHVIFNSPATIVFWKDGTKTVVKYDGKGRKDRRQAVLYAFIRKIYGEGKPYHNILNEIEEAIK